MSTQLGKYRLVRRLGAGGMGEVWEAVDTVLERAVAVKLLHPRGEAGEADELVREAAAAAKVSHPNAVAVFDAVAADGRWFLVMEFVAGQSAAARVAERGRLPWEEATRIARDAAAGLAAVHAAGLIHRDVKPANVLLTPDGTAKVADFGLARRTVRSGLTVGSQVVGTPHYMSPEQCWSESADGRADVYSLGATYFTLLTGRTPYEAGTDMAVMYAHCNSAVPDPRDRMPDVPAACAAIVRRAMAKQPPDRYPTADALRAALDQVLSGSLVPLPPPAGPAALPPPTVSGPALAWRPRGRLTRRALLAAVPASAVAVGLVAYLWPTPLPREGPPDAGGGSDVTPEIVRRPADAQQPPAGPQLPADPWPTGRAVHDVAVSPNGKLVAVPCQTEDGKADAIHLRTWDGKPVPGWAERGRGFAPEGVEFSADGRYLAGAYRSGGMVRVWRLADWEEGTVEGTDGVFYASRVAFSTDGEWLVAGGFDGEVAKVVVWRWNGKLHWERKHEYRAKETGFWGFALEPKGFRLALATGEGHDDASRSSFVMLDIRTGKPTDGPAVNATRRGIGPAIAFTPAGDRLAFSAGGTTTVYTVKGWAAQPQAFPKADSEIWSLAFTPDGGILAAADSNIIHLWQTATGKELKKIVLDGRVFGLTAAPDGRTLISGREWIGRPDEVLVQFHDLTPLLR